MSKRLFPPTAPDTLSSLRCWTLQEGDSQMDTLRTTTFSSFALASWCFPSALITLLTSPFSACLIDCTYSAVPIIVAHGLT